MTICFVLDEFVFSAMRTPLHQSEENNRPEIEDLDEFRTKLTGGNFIIVEEIINTAFRLFCNKFGQGGISANNESSFQFEIGSIIRTLGQLYEFKKTDNFHLGFEEYIHLDEKTQKSKSNRARVDLLITYQFNNTVTRAAIELKFFKKVNHREPNNRYDVFQDISNLEMYKRNGIDLCYFILVTDHEHYVIKPSYSPDTLDFDFKHGSVYTAGKVLSYRTKKPHGPDLTLTQNHTFLWGKVKNMYFLKLKV